MLQVGHLYNKKEPEAEGDAVDAERLLQRLLAKLLRFNCITRHTAEACLVLCSNPVTSVASVSMQRIPLFMSRSAAELSLQPEYDA